jgi:guanine deaminase
MENGHGGPFGCVVVKDGEIIASAFNEALKNNDPTAHAEVLAIRRACQKLNTFQLDGCEIYTSCEPCPMCLGAIYWSRPSKVYYAASRGDAAQAGFDDNHIYDQFNLPLPNRNIPFEQIMEQDVKDIFTKWVSMKLDIKY